ncbi:NAD-dependent epimerase/dehydratase family protein, partial [Mesorhizobium sp. M7A.F.Ca.CA.001.08.1.1]|uniref:NAD-dependent epimerase/dehydratase family protein n=1 Tax=Mesorhizobium sp. M7A.F.Ca.CA.001.08.1.1 TaxID=2496691 RepID=UPI001FDF2CF6
MTEILQTPKLVVVFGGSGFVGRHVVRALAKRGYRIRVACRRPDLAGHLQPLGNVGQIQPVQANVRVRWSVDRAVQGADRARGLGHCAGAELVHGGEFLPAALMQDGDQIDDMVGALH